MKLTVLVVFLAGIPGSSSAVDPRDVVFTISPAFGVSSDTATICRVTVTNYSGHSLDGRLVGFEASALENGTAVVRERGRFGGVIANGETAETLIGFNGVFRGFSVELAPVSSRAHRGSGKGQAGATKRGSSRPKAQGRRRKPNAN